MARGQDEVAMQRGGSDTMREIDGEIRGVFEGVLPGTEEKNHLSLLVHPYFGDFHRKSYLRAPVGLRYGLTDRWDVSAELEGYVSHGFDEVKVGEEWGISAVQVTTKYRPGWTLVPGWQMAGRLRYTHPLDHPPEELTDGFKHIMPAVTFAREIERWPGAEVFWGTGMDLGRRSHIGGALEQNEFGDDANTLTGGMVWQRG